MDQRRIRIFRAIAWTTLIAIVVITLVRVDVLYGIYRLISPLLLHPSISVYGHITHVTAFVVIGLLFGVAYQRHPVRVAAILSAAAILLELMQTLTPDRHGVPIDAFEKAGGGVAGVLIAQLFTRRSRRS